jgi:hypothetical protein
VTGHYLLPTVVTDQHQLQQMSLLSSQQQFFQQITETLKVVNRQATLPAPTGPRPPTPVKVVPPDEEEEDDDDEYEEVWEDVVPQPVQTVSINDEAAAQSMGEMINTLKVLFLRPSSIADLTNQPFVDMIRKQKQKAQAQPLNSYQYDQKPEVPDSMKDQDAELTKKGLLDGPKSEDVSDSASSSQTPDTGRQSSKRNPVWRLDA